MPALAAEGGDSRNLARLASRLARANAAIEVLADGAERYLALQGARSPRGAMTLRAFVALPEEIRLRLLKRAIDRFGHEGPAELGKVEALLVALDQAAGAGDGKTEVDPGRRADLTGQGPNPRRTGPAAPRRVNFLTSGGCSSRPRKIAGRFWLENAIWRDRMLRSTS